ncbi:MAG: hypothetical protein LQ350_004727 [Teloschistes chrysophthalmus]|nr:MAG: hypothetical protein LQ350_004727 [Niorma chrysophthalma]
MTIRDLLKKKEKNKQDAGQTQSSSAAEASPPPTPFTIMRSDTNTEEVISPPSFAEDDKPESTTKDAHSGKKRFSRFRKPSNASMISTVSSHTEKRLSTRLHIGSHSRSSSAGSVNVPSDLPAIRDGTGEGEEKEAEWEKRATILAQENAVVKQTRSREGSVTAGSGSGGRPPRTRSLSDARSDENLQEAIELHEAGGE